MSSYLNLKVAKRSLFCTAYGNKQTLFIPTYSMVVLNPLHLGTSWSPYSWSTPPLLNSISICCDGVVSNTSENAWLVVL